MARGFAVSAGSGTQFEAKTTPIVIMSCIMAATGGLMFGYDIGVFGGVTSMDDFLLKFFPKVYGEKKEKRPESNYCKYDNQSLQWFTSLFYLAGLTATFFSSYTTRRLGRRLTMLIAGAFFISGVIFNGAAQNLAMLIIGRILLGCGVGFANQAVPLFLSEIAPTRIRGGLNILCQLNVTVGILFGTLINYRTIKIHPWGWRLSLALAGIPALLLTVGSLLVVETPNSLIERGKLEEGKAVLKRIRGTDNVEPEFNEILEASRIAQQVKHPFRNLLRRHNRPQLIIAILLQIFQQFAGINNIIFYGTVLFNTLGSNKLVMAAVISGIVNVLSTVASIYCVDKVGRRALLLEAGVQMFLSQVIIAVVFSIKVTDHSDNLSHGYAVLVVIIQVVGILPNMSNSLASNVSEIGADILKYDFASAGPDEPCPRSNKGMEMSGKTMVKEPIARRETALPTNVQILSIAYIIPYTLCVMVCVFVSSFAWSWGPLGWLIPSEIFPLGVRSAGQSVTVCVNLLFTFAIAQAFLSMLCHFKSGIFILFAGWVVVMSIFVLFFLPETKNIPIEEITERVWKQHWFWKRYVDDDDAFQ
ncbi:Sugar/inositol transporter protein [Dioscorea alata]|uniref:Sugar/inositol transporter protein n=1 Tax=Dioscorea alata TaxID=55571 RepID=A0ACB7U0I7_DIOAL|nr:Sugar/inositol transporter protein [Dioscorea alata]